MSALIQPIDHGTPRPAAPASRIDAREIRPSRLASGLGSSVRAAWLVGEVLLAGARFAFAWLRSAGRPPMVNRSLLLHSSSRRILRVIGCSADRTGEIPASGLLVCNHLSYVDILVLGATMPCVFVAKSEVRAWPVLGWLAAMAGTMFVRRHRRSDVTRAADRIRDALDTGVLVVLFPEGTSSGGDEVLPFKSSLLAAVNVREHCVTAAAIGYELAGGVVADDVCYWREMTLVPHLWNLLGKRGLAAQVAFGPGTSRRSKDRKVLARALHLEVTQLKHLLPIVPGNAIP